MDERCQCYADIRSPTQVHCLGPRLVGPDIVHVVFFGCLHYFEVDNVFSFFFFSLFFQKPAHSFSMSQDICDKFQKQVRRGVLWDLSLAEINPVACVDFPPAYDALRRPKSPDRHFQSVSDQHPPRVQVGSLCDRHHVW